MNALHPLPAPAGVARPSASEAGRTLRLIRRLVLLYVVYALTIAAVMLAGRGTAAGEEVRRSGAGGVGLGALLLCLAGLLGLWPIVEGRLAWARQEPVRAALRRMPRRLTWLPADLDAGQRLSRMARRPQGVIVPLVCFAAATAAWALRPGSPMSPGAPAMLIGCSTVVLTFPLLVAERIGAGIALSRLPEAAALRALLRAPVMLIPLAGLVEVAGGLGLGWAAPAMTLLALLVVLIAAELSLRALANWFLPPPDPAQARAAIASASALLFQPGRIPPGGLAAPLRAHLGLDFSRSWALRYLRAAALPTALLMGLVGWGLTGVTLIDLDRRGIAERFGFPVAVWQPGMHLGLPWPLGRVRLVELGVVHTAGLGGDIMPDAAAGAEDAAPVSADRLWDVAHPAELSYIIAATDTAGAQSFASVSVDLKVLYRDGLDDASALRAAYAVDAPEALLRAEAGRLLARLFAGQVLADAIGENREALAESLRATLQAELDRAGSGIELLGVMIEAIHPPPGAADAYHNVQAAEIVANTAITTERGRAQATAAQARQQATEVTTVALGTAAETVGQAGILLRTFAADQAAAAVGRKAFLMERYYANLSAALARSPLVIIDHRLRGAEAPVIDLRSFGAPAGQASDAD